MDLRQSREYGEYMTKCGWRILQLSILNSQGSINVFIKKLPFLPLSVMKVQRFEGEINWGKLKKIQKKYRVIYSVLEPLKINTDEHQWPINTNYKLSNSPYLPTKTIVLDLRKTEGELLREMSKDTRQKLRFNNQFLISNIETISNDQISNFQKKWKKQKKGYVPSLKSLINMKESFGDKWWILVAKTPSRADVPLPLGRGRHNGLLAGLIILESDDTAYYYFAWTNEQGRKLNAQYQLMWEAIKTAKQKGLKFFDMEGIEDSRWPNKNWQGFSLFKKKWGGKEVSFPGSWQKWF